MRGRMENAYEGVVVFVSKIEVSSKFFCTKSYLLEALHISSIPG